MSILDTATDYLHAGLCVLPAILAEKRPALAGWKQYQRRLPTERQVRTWFADDFIWGQRPHRRHPDFRVIREVGAEIRCQ